MDSNAADASDVEVWGSTTRTAEEMEEHTRRVPCAPERRWTRRAFTRRAVAVIIGSSALLGRLVSFTPTASAYDYDCEELLSIEKSCYGGYSNFESCCQAGVIFDVWCCCDCASGDCSPKFARAHAVFFTSECCCAT